MRQTVTVDQIEVFLRAVDQSFPIPLSDKQDLSAYARKLYEHATLCAACKDGKIVSMVAGYTENLTGDWAYIAIVATLPEGRGQGTARRLVQEFIQICAQKQVRAVHLYAVSENIAAMRLYQTLGFRALQLDDEPRKSDAHLIYDIEVL